MKPQNKILFTALSGLALATACLVAYASPGKVSVDSDQLNQGITLFNQGRVDEAHACLTNVPTSSPLRGEAKAYDALCRYAKGDHKKFLSTLDSPEVKAAALPDEVREELDYKQIDSLMYFRKFDEVLPKAEQFNKNHARSPRASAMAEYQRASRYERGMKKLTEAAQLRVKGATAEADFRLKEGEVDLEQYLKLTADSQRDRYDILTDRNLPMETVKTLAALGGEAEARQVASEADPEETELALVQLHRKIDADADAKLGRMTKFLKDFPESKQRHRVELDMGNVAFEEGWRLAWTKPYTNGTAYLAQARDVLGNVAVDAQAGLSEADVAETKVYRAIAIFAQRDWKEFSTLTEQLLTNTPVGSRDWIAIKLYQGYAHFNQNQKSQAAAKFDEVLATGFKGVPTYDGLLVSAAFWRIQGAWMAFDDATVQRVTKMVEDSQCYDSRKRAFAGLLKKFYANAHRGKK